MLRFYSIFHAPKVLLLSIEIIIIIIIDNFLNPLNN